MDLTVMRRELHRLTDAQIAELIGHPIEEVKLKIDFITGGGQIRKSKSQQLLLSEIKKHAGKEKKQRQVKLLIINKKQKEKKTIAWREDAVEKQNRIERSKMKTRIIDYSKLIAVRVDNKTIIYADPGIDINKVKADYLQKVAATKEKIYAKEKTSVTVSKFK